MLALEWIGKDKLINNSYDSSILGIGTPSFLFDRPKYSSGNMVIKDN